MVDRIHSALTRTESTPSLPAAMSSQRSFQLVSLLWFAAMTLLMVPMATLVDVPIARWIATHPAPDWLDQLLDFSVYYSHAYGVFFALVMVIVLVPSRRWCVPRLATLAMGAGAVATVTKLFVLRPRPGSLYLEAADYEYAWIWDFDFTLSQVASFDPATRAFPSASLATATALTAGLWVIVPRARWMCCLLCLGTMVQRAFCNAHFTSDLFGSASVGLGWAYVCFHPSLMGSLFDKIEPEKTVSRSRHQRRLLSQPLKQLEQTETPESNNLFPAPLQVSEDQSGSRATISSSNHSSKAA